MVVQVPPSLAFKLECFFDNDNNVILPSINHVHTSRSGGSNQASSGQEHINLPPVLPSLRSLVTLASRKRYHPYAFTAPRQVLQSSHRRFFDDVKSVQSLRASTLCEQDEPDNSPGYSPMSYELAPVDDLLKEDEDRSFRILKHLDFDVPEPLTPLSDDHVELKPLRFQPDAESEQSIDSSRSALTGRRTFPSLTRVDRHHPYARGQSQAKKSGNLSPVSNASTPRAKSKCLLRPSIRCRKNPCDHEIYGLRAARRAAGEEVSPSPPSTPSLSEAGSPTAEPSPTTPQQVLWVCQELRQTPEQMDSIASAFQYDYGSDDGDGDENWPAGKHELSSDSRYTTIDSFPAWTNRALADTTAGPFMRLQLQQEAFMCDVQAAELDCDVEPGSPSWQPASPTWQPHRQNAAFYSPISASKI